MFKKSLIFCSIIIMSLAGQAKTSSQGTLGSNDEQKEALKINAGLSVDHSMGFKTDSDETTDFSLSFSSKLSDKHSLLIVQNATKYYLINPGESELLFSDTYFYHTWSLMKNDYVNIGLRNSYTLPVSDRSKENDSMGRFEQRLSFGRSFFDKKLYIGYRPYYRYFFNKYIQGPNQKALNEYSIGHSVLIDFSVHKKLSIVALAAQGLNFIEKSKFENQDVQANGTYLYNTYLNASITSKLGARLGYTQSSSQISDGRQEIYFFDEDSSGWNVGLDYSF